MVFFRYINVNTLHEGDNKDNNVKKRLCIEIQGMWNMENMITQAIILATEV